MGMRETRTRFPRKQRLNKLTFGDQQTRNVWIDQTQDVKTTFWCRNDRGKRCTIGGCGDCATEIDGRIAHTVIASCADKKTGELVDYRWNVSDTLLDQLLDAMPAGAAMCELEVTRMGTGFDTEYEVQLLGSDAPEDGDDDGHPDDDDGSDAPRR